VVVDDSRKYFVRAGWLLWKFSCEPSGMDRALSRCSLVYDRVLNGILGRDVRDVHGGIIVTMGEFFMLRPLLRPFYLCFLTGAGFFAGWDFFAGSDFFCTLTGAFTAVFLLGTPCFTAGLATAAGFATGP
jgi:hypothetical protein